MKNIPTFESFVNESNVSIPNLSDVDHTRLIKWMSSYIDSKYSVKKSGSNWIVDTSKLSKNELADLMDYLKSQEYIKECAVIENELFETTINTFRMTELGPKDRINAKVFAKMMPRTAKTCDEAEEWMSTWEGNTMFVHYQYHIVMPHGNKPDRPKYRIHQSQYWLNDTQLKWQGKVGEKVNVTCITIYDITDPDNEKRLGATYVFTDAFLDELNRVWEVIRRQS